LTNSLSHCHCYYNYYITIIIIIIITIVIIIIIIMIFSGIVAVDSIYFCIWCFSLLKFTNTGITGRNREEFLQPLMEGRKDVSHTPVTLDMVMNIYVVWAVGILVSVLILGFERLFHKQRRRKKLNSKVSVL
jgi:hypothetical protein